MTREPTEELTDELTTGTVSRDPLAAIAERQHWIAPAAEVAAQQTIRDAFKPLGDRAEPVRRALHGTWLHEPLHAILTDIPVGSWTAAVLFDSLAALSGSRAMDTAADASVLLGLVGAVGASVTGLNDWAEIESAAPRRIGAVHALLNIAATGLFTASALRRRRASSSGSGRASARALAMIGYLLVSASAHLGGNLVYEHGIGVESETADPLFAPNP